MNRHLGIWYINIPSKVLWTATRNSPLTDLYGKLAIGTNGNLVLLNRNASSIWSLNVSTTPKTRVTQLLDSGNLVLKENTSSVGTYVWQSFDNPFDTLLLSMKISWNINTGSERHLTSRKSIDDPSTSDFSYKIDMKGLPQLVVVTGASAIKYQTRPRNGVRFSGLPAPADSIFNTVMELHEHEWYYNVAASQLRLDQFGSLQRLVLNVGEAQDEMLYFHYQMIHVTIMDTVVLIVFVEIGIPYVSQGSLRGFKKNGNFLMEPVDA
ncbi:hypothetical protein C1H46_037323 [Malus baccata]|uniref:Bulb-type lectin domain-containing protein n=1 Tax=Malus baccata TaxID=106549 RepID=A0A540KSM1_MALBA|nr:hypothetical protein C1H46_037323 [Malus baccata]